MEVGEHFHGAHNNRKGRPIQWVQIPNNHKRLQIRDAWYKLRVESRSLFSVRDKKIKVGGNLFNRKSNTLHI